MIKSTDTMYSLINQNSTEYYISSKLKCSSIDWESNIVVTLEFLGSFEFPVRYFEILFQEIQRNGQGHEMNMFPNQSVHTTQSFVKWFRITEKD